MNPLLDPITAELRGMASSGDPEAAHARADELLIRAFEIVRDPNHYGRDDVADLIEAWQNVPKWYA